MKKFIISAMIVASAIAFMACGGNASNSSSNADTTAVEATTNDAQAVAEEGAQKCPMSEGGACDSAACAQSDTCTKACGENCQKAE